MTDDCDDADCDVLVVGGGPAGSTVASRLAQLGHRVVLVDRGRGTRRRETLAPGTVDLLALTGADASVRAAGFDHVDVSHVDWGQPARERAAGGSLLVDRPAFDALLIERAAELGVRVIRPGVARVRDGATAIEVATPTGRRRVRARFVVDAAGRRRAASALVAPATLSITGLVLGPAATAPSVHARPDAWFWCAPVPGGCQVTAFVDPTGSGERPTDRLRSLIDAATFFEPGTWRIAGRARAADATPTVAADTSSATSLRVGDAAVALDPLSSTGVQKAVQGALTAAVVVNTVLRRPADASAALDHHRRAVLTAAEHHAAWAASSYADGAAAFGTSFWRARAAGVAADAPAPGAAPVPPPQPGLRVRVSERASIVDATRLDGEFVTTGTAVRHPGLDGEVAYVAGVALVPLLGAITAPAPLGDIVRSWSAEIEPLMAARLAGWLYRRGVLEEVDAA